MPELGGHQLGACEFARNRSTTSEFRRVRASRSLHLQSELASQPKRLPARLALAREKRNERVLFTYTECWVPLEPT